MGIYIKDLTKEDWDNLTIEEIEENFEIVEVKTMPTESNCDYENAVEQMEHDMLYEPTYNADDGSM